MFFYRDIFSVRFTFQFVTFCEKLARVMKLDEIANDVGLDVNGDALLARGEQLVKLEVRHPMDQSDINASILSTRIANANVSLSVNSAVTDLVVFTSRAIYSTLLWHNRLQGTENCLFTITLKFLQGSLSVNFKIFFGFQNYVN